LKKAAFSFNGVVFNLTLVGHATPDGNPCTAATSTPNVAAAADDIAASSTLSIILLHPEQASQSSCLQPQTQLYTVNHEGTLDVL
jgi:hypothetical protein